MKTFPSAQENVANCFAFPRTAHYERTKNYLEIYITHVK